MKYLYWREAAGRPARIFRGAKRHAHDRRRSDRHRLHGQVPCAGLDRRSCGVRRRAARPESHAVRGRRGARAATGRRVRLRGSDRRLAGIDRRSGRGSRLDHHAQRLARANGDCGARSWQARMVREADGAFARGRRADGGRGPRLRPGRDPRLQLYPEPGHPDHRQADEERYDRPAHPFPPRNGRGLHGRRARRRSLGAARQARAMARSTILPSTR